MTKFIFVLIFFTALGSSLAEDKNHFFSNLEKKTEKQQVDILKTRLQFMGRTGMNLQTSKTSALYFKLSGADKNRLDVLLKIAANPHKDDKFGEIYKLMLDECPVRECFSFLLQNHKVFQGSLKSVVDGFILEQFNYDTVDIAIAHKNLIQTLLMSAVDSEIEGEGEKLKWIFKKTVFFGFDKVSQKLIEKHDKLLISDNWALLNKCRFLYQQNKVADAEKCYDIYPDDLWYEVGKLYMQFAQRQPVTTKGKSTVTLLLENTKGAPFYADALFYKAFFEKKISSEDVDQFRASGGFDSPYRGFLLLCLAQAQGETSQTLVKKDLETYSKANAAHAFVDVLRGKQDTSYICDNLGLSSIYCEACRGTAIREIR